MSNVEAKETVQKAKSVTSGLFDKAKKTVMRAKQQVMVKMGVSEQTIDIQFEQERTRFKEHYKAVQKLSKDTGNMVVPFRIRLTKILLRE